MSASTPAAASSSSQSHKRPRDDDAGGENDDEAKRGPPASRAAVSRVHLHRHALESIFACLDIAGLATALAVSRDWQAAVGSTRGIGSSLDIVSSAAFLQLLSSRLRRHVTEIMFEESYPLTAELLALLHFRMPHMLRLQTETVTLSSGADALLWPQQLQVLMLDKIDAALVDANALLRSVGHLSRMRDLSLELHHDASLSFAPLASLSLLRSLRIDWNGIVTHPLLSSAQENQFRALADLDDFAVPMHADSMMQLLRLPHALRWKNATLHGPDDAACELLPHLSCLTDLHIYAATCTHFDFLPRTQHLCQLRVELHQHHPAADAVTLSLVDALRHCRSISKLWLAAKYMPIRAEQLAACLADMSALKVLCIWDASLSTLGFLGLPSLAQSLQFLALCDCRPPRPASSELHHLHGLTSLTGLTLHNALAAPLDDDTRAAFQPPSLLLPQLQNFSYKHDYPD